MGRWRRGVWGAVGLAILAAGATRVGAAGPPAPSAADVAGIAAGGKRAWPAVLLVGRADLGHGTAFVISRRHRLVATAAHVADLLVEAGRLEAIGNGTATSYAVERAWYHPGLTRLLDDDLAARSPDPRDGQVAVPGPDVAVLKLAPGGPDLPAELPLAGPDDWWKLKGRAVGLIGFPGGEAWPTPDAPARAVFHYGQITEQTDFGDEDEGSAGARQVLGYTIPEEEGSSGSPVFLANGRVVAVHNVIRHTRTRATTRTIGQGVRIDCLWELLVYHGLDELVPDRPPADSFRVPDQPTPDPRIGDYRRAVARLRASRTAASLRDYKRAGELCNDAIRLAPQYAAAFEQRSRVRTHFCGENWAKLSDEEKGRQVSWAIEDAAQGMKLGGAKRTGSYLLFIELLLYAGCIDRDTEMFERAREGAEAFLTLGVLDPGERSHALNCRAQARQFLGDLDGALKDYTEAIRLSPGEPNLYRNRAAYWDRRGRSDLAAQDRRTAEGLRSRVPR